MKKLFVFVLVVSLLAFAGGVWADTDDAGHSDLVSHGTSGSGSTIATAPTDAEFFSAAATVSPALASYLTASADYGSDGYERKLLSNDVILSMDSTAASNLATLPSGYAKYSFPKLSFDANAYTVGNVLQIVMPSNMSLSGVQKLHFYPDLVSGTTEATKGMWFIWASNPDSTGKVTWTKINSDSTASQIAASVNHRLVLEFIYQATAPFVNTSATASVNTGAAGSASSSTSGGGLSSSGGGCAVGTSALALAVLGLFIAKRRG